MSSGNKKNFTWFLACRVEDVPENGGVCVKYHSKQIALFHFARRNEWYATQNMCPHRQQMAISRGMMGTHNGEPKIACPFHKKIFSLIDGRCMNADEGYSIKTYRVKIKDDSVFIEVCDDEIIDQQECPNHTYEKIDN